MGPPLRLTNKIVEAFQFAGKKTKSGFSAHYEWDDLSGFGVRIYPTGSKSFVVKYRNQYNKQRYYTIGTFPEISTSAARKEAEEVRAKVRAGEDPRAEKDALKGQKSVAEICDLYMELYSRPNKKSWKQDLRAIDRYIKPRFVRLAAGEVTRKKLQKTHVEIRDGVNVQPDARTGKAGGPQAANSVLILISMIYKWAMENDFIPFARLPTNGIKEFPRRIKKRRLHPAEMPWYLRAVGEMKNEEAKAAVLFQMYTCCRPGEARTLKWEDVNFATKSATFRDTKNGKDHTIPLSLPALAIVESLPRFCDWVFAGQSKDAPIGELNYFVKNLRERAEEIAKSCGVEINLSDVTAHDLRRTGASWLASSGYSDSVIATILNHARQGVTGSTYAHLSDEAIRAALEDLATQYQATLIEDTNVIPFLIRQ